MLHVTQPVSVPPLRGQCCLVPPLRGKCGLVPPLRGKYLLTLVRQSGQDLPPGSVAGDVAEVLTCADFRGQSPFDVQLVLRGWATMNSRPYIFTF